MQRSTESRVDSRKSKVQGRLLTEALYRVDISALDFLTFDSRLSTLDCTFDSRLLTLD